MNKAPIKDNMNGDEFQEMIGTCLTKPLGDNYEKLCKELKIVNDGSTESYQQLGQKSLLNYYQIVRNLWNYL